jgi:hypothetical protein
MANNNQIYKMSNAGGFKSLNRYYDMLAGNTTFVDSSFDSIQTVTVGAGGQSSVSFTSIPSTYKHLQVRYLSKNVASASYFETRLNSDASTSNYTWHYLQGSGSAASAGAATTGTFPGAVINYAAGAGANIYSVGVIDFLDYTDTNKYKTIRSLSGFDANGSGFVSLTSSLWLNTAAITGISFQYNGGTNVEQYSSFALYGIRG